MKRSGGQFYPKCNQVYNRKGHQFCFISEIEAIEACKWLRAAGFPQYAQMYEGKCHINTTIITSHIM